MKTAPTGGQPPAVELRPSIFSAWRSRAAWALFLFFVLAYYWFFISAGRISSWPDWGGRFYDAQAEGFRAGQLHTIMQPNPKLLLLPNPYAYENRELWAWDYSLYGGRLYLYWGLTPAALLALFKSLLRIGSTVQDSVLVFTFLCLRVLGGSLLIRALARQFTPAPPRWALGAALLVFALAHPTPFLMARPAIYEAALTGGACFIVWAYYFAFRWLAEGPVTAQLRWLAAASACLGLAGTTRPSLLPAAALFALLLLVRALTRLWLPIWQPLAPRSLAAVAAAGPGSPLAVERSAAGSAWWALLRCGAAALVPFTVLTLTHLLVNQLRFGSWREFGVSYQLGIPFDIAPRYVIANLFNYWLHPWHSSCRFPFLLPRWHETVPMQYHLPSWIEVPEGYYAYEPLTGVLLAVPFCWLLLTLPLGLLWRRWRRCGPASLELSPQDAAERRSAWRWFKAIVILVTLVSSVPVLMLFAFTMRYEAEFVSGLLVLSCLAGWRWLAIPQRPVGRRFAGIAYGCIALLTIVLGAPFGFTGYYDSFQMHNPALFARLQAALSTCPASEGGCPTVHGCGP